jgi:hypothetical protein
MGAGTLVELLARGKQDTYIIGNPQMSYFQSVYKRHTNFSMEPIRQLFSEVPDFGKRVTCTIDKKADLLSDIMIDIELPALAENVSWCNGVGNFMIDYVELQLGGEPIDRIYGDMIDIWYELTTNLGVKNAYYKMIGKFITFNKTLQTGALHLLVQVPFWFCRNIGQSLPLISMQYTDVKLVVQFKTFDQCWYKRTLDTPPTQIHITSASVICNYIYLDVFERLKFTKREQYEFLIEQFQTTNPIGITNGIINFNMPINFNHPVKELYWTYRSTYALNDNDYYNYSNILNYGTVNETSVEPFVNIQLKYNGNDRFEILPGIFFRLYQQYKHHTSAADEYIYVYSFALNPEKNQPSGTCNFSKLDDVRINFTMSPNIDEGAIVVYGVNYNVLRIQQGMCGLMFSS